MKIVSVSQMRAIEKEANAHGYTYAQMMEHAGHGLAQIVRSLFEKDEEEEEKIALGLVGSGNNGGDTLVALATLAQCGWEAVAYLARPRPEDDILIRRLIENGGEVLSLEQDPDLHTLDVWISSSTVLLDGILGTGVQLPLKPELANFIRHVALFEPLPYVVAVDCPSGVDCESGAAAEDCIQADMTICMEAIKAGLLRFPAFKFVGELKTIDLELPKDYTSEENYIGEVVTPDLVRTLLPKRPLEAHKGTFGTAMIVAGSTNYTGAVFLAGKSAYRIGAGLVRMAIPGPLHAVLAGHLPEAIWLILPHSDGVISSGAEDVLIRNLENVTALLIGPGLGLEDTTAEFLQRLLTSKLSILSKLPPLVIDADGLTLLAKIPDWPKLLPGSTILTPHPGEMSRLTGLETRLIQADRIEVARHFSVEWKHVVVLKGALTVISDPKGRIAVVPVATPALARAGTGDVLAGIITGLLAQGLSPADAALAGAWLHAKAGIIASNLIGHPAAVLAHDILDALPEVLRYL